MMKMEMAQVLERRSRGAGPLADLAEAYLGRCGHSWACSSRSYGTERELLERVERAVSRTRPVLVVMDRGGVMMGSEEFAGMIGGFRDGGVQQMLVAVGPASGWTEAALSRADRVISFGTITLPHELAFVVAAEQVYRAFTILTGHPYHTGH